MNKRGPARSNGPTLSTTTRSPRKDHDRIMRGQHHQDRRAVGDNGVPANGNEPDNT